MREIISFLFYSNDIKSIDMIYRSDTISNSDRIYNSDMVYISGSTFTGVRTDSNDRMFI